jgi:dipeptidase D
VGVAAALAVLSQRDLVHPPLEVLITVDEETGLTGANALRAGWMKATRLLNLDSEEEGELTIGCAGGSDSVATRPVSLVAPSSGRKVHRLKVAGLRGGHSGIDIAAGRGNAIRILAQTLKALERTFDLEVGAVRGGNKRNAIPREASALLYLEPAEEAPVSLEVARILAEWRSALGAFDPNLAISLEPPPSELSDQPGAVLTAPDRSALLGLLLSGPHGVEAMSPDIPGLVQTSTNLGVVETRAHSVEVTFLTRSSIDASKAALSARIAATASLAGFSVTESNGYSGWKPEPSSEVVALVKKVHLELFGKPMVVKAIHAGLECGLIGEKYPGMEMASIGPSMWDVHTPDERVSIGSVQNFWRLLTAILERA